MSTYGGKELAREFRTVRKNTIQVAEDIQSRSTGTWRRRSVVRWLEC